MYARGEDRGPASVTGPADTESLGSTSADTTDKSQAGFPDFLHTHSEQFNPPYRSTAHKPDMEDFNTTSKNNRLHHRYYFQHWVSMDAQEGKKPPQPALIPQS